MVHGLGVSSRPALVVLRGHPFGGRGVAVAGHNGVVDMVQRTAARVSERGADALIALAYLAGGGLLYLFDLYRLVAFAEPALGWRVVLLVAVCATVTQRRRRPVMALLLASVPVVIDVALGPSLPVWLAFGDLLYAATLYGPRRAGVAVLRASIALTGMVAAASGWLGGSLQFAVIGAAFGVLLLVVPVAWAWSVRRHRDAAQAERARAQIQGELLQLHKERAREQVAAAGREHAVAVAAERQQLARDLHDVVAGHLSAIALQSEALLTTGSRLQQRSVLESVRANSVTALGEMQAMIGVLQGAEPDPVATAPRLSDLGELFSTVRAAGHEVTLDIQVPTDLPSHIDVTAYRLCQEALTNAMKHAPQAPVDLRVTEAGDALKLEIINPPGMAPASGTAPDQAPLFAQPEPHPVEEMHVARTDQHGANGLSNMADRAGVVGGSLQAGWRAGQWHVSARLPLHPLTTRVTSPRASLEEPGKGAEDGPSRERPEVLAERLAGHG